MEKLNRVKLFILGHPELFTILGLSILFYFIFFHNIWAYALMDVDESRYVSMAKDMFNTKDFMTLYLNKEYFFEKPPLYFWGECLSFGLFGAINEFTARFPVALYGTLCCFLLYFTGKHTVSRKYGIISSLILATSLEFLILAKFAILDIVVTTCVGFSIYLGMMVFYCKEGNKKYFWWLFYIFSGLAVMAKGLPGFVVPFGSMFFIAILNKQFKEIFKPSYFVVGFILFLIIVLPWHILMLKTYNPLFYNEYIVKHHLARFLGTEGVIGRTQPFYFYFLTILWGFFPWILSCVTVWINNLIKIIKHKTYKIDITNYTPAQKFLFFNAVIAIFTILFFSSSETKLITYILPMYLPLSCLAAFVWKEYIEENKNEKLINITNYFVGYLFVVVSIVAIFTPLFLPAQLSDDISIARLFCILLLFAVGIALVLFTKKRLYLGIFCTYVFLMAMLSGIGTQKFYNIDYRFGQNDLLEYAQYAKENNKDIATYQFSHKYSLIYYAEKPIFYGLDLEEKDINRITKNEKKLLIIPHKKYKKLNNKNLNIIKDGRKYMLVGE